MIRNCSNCHWCRTGLTGKKKWKCKLNPQKRFDIRFLHGWFCEIRKEIGMKREMVRLTLHEDGTYKVEDTSPDYATQRMYGVDKDGRDADVYYCRKDKWEWYLSKLLNSKVKDIDKEIKILQKKKKEMEKLKNEVLKNLEEKNETVL